MAQLFIDPLPGRQVFVALLVLPVVVSPIVAGATWSLMFDNRFGPINQIIGWIAGAPDDTAVDASIPIWSIRPSSRPRSGSGRRSCSCCCWRRCRQRGQVAARSGGHRRRRLLAHVLADRPAGDLAGDGDRDPDPRAGPVPAVRHRLGAHQRRPGHEDRDHLDLHLRQGLPAIRDQLHRGGRAADHRAAVGRGVRGAQARRSSRDEPRGHSRRRVRTAARLAAAVAVTTVLPVPDLLAVHDLLQDSRGDLLLSAEVVPGQSRPGQLRGAVQGRRRGHGVEQPRDRGREHAARDVSRHDLRLQPRALRDRRRAPRQLDHLPAHGAAHRGGVPDLPAVRVAAAGSTPTSA